MASSGSVTTVSGSYSTSIRSMAAWAISSVSAATAATRSPTKRTVSSKMRSVSIGAGACI